MWPASQVEGEREPPTSRNDSLGVDVGGGAGGGGEGGGGAWGRGGCMWVELPRGGLMWAASQVEGERGPPTSQNDSLRVDVAGVAGGGGERAPHESFFLVGGGGARVSG